MARSRFCQGNFRPKNPKKYKGVLRGIVYRSSWELRTMIYFDTNDAILEWSSEEIYVPYISPKDNLIHRYFVDFLVKAQTKTGVKTFLVEVKPECQIQPPKQRKRVTPSYFNDVLTYAINQAKWEAAKQYCAIKGWEFMLLNEFDLGIKNTK